MIRLYTRYQIHMYVISVNWYTAIMIHLHTYVRNLHILGVKGLKLVEPRYNKVGYSTSLFETLTNLLINYERKNLCTVHPYIHM